MSKPSELKEWGFLALLFLPVIILGRLRLHQSNLALFLIISVLLVTCVTLAYLHYCRKWHLLANTEVSSEQLDEAEAALEKRGIQED